MPHPRCLREAGSDADWCKPWPGRTSRRRLAAVPAPVGLGHALCNAGMGLSKSHAAGVTQQDDRRIGVDAKRGQPGMPSAGRSRTPVDQCGLASSLSEQDMKHRMKHETTSTRKPRHHKSMCGLTCDRRDLGSDHLAGRRTTWERWKLYSPLFSYRPPPPPTPHAGPLSEFLHDAGTGVYLA